MEVIQEVGVQFLGWEGLLERERATHSHILAWEILSRHSMLFVVLFIFLTSISLDSSGVFLFCFSKLWCGFQMRGIKLPCAFLKRVCLLCFTAYLLWYYFALVVVMT